MSCQLVTIYCLVGAHFLATSTGYLFLLDTITAVDGGSIYDNAQQNDPAQQEYLLKQQEQAAARAIAAAAAIDSDRPDSNSSGADPIGLNLFGNLEMSIAAVFNKVAYGSTTTTKRSISDVYLKSMTTVPTPSLTTTYRYRGHSDDEGHSNGSGHHHHHGAGAPSRNYELDLERDHALPTSAPNADILKSNDNPTYPNPNRHHGAGANDAQRHRHIVPPSTLSPSIHNILLKKGASGGSPTLSMYSGDNYPPPQRALFTPPLPPEYQNPFADKPTLRGTNSDGSVISSPSANIPVPAGNGQGVHVPAAGTNSLINRRPIPPPSLMPGHERIPLRPPQTGNSGSDNRDEQKPPVVNKTEPPTQKPYSGADQETPQSGNSNNNAALHFPSISRILSGSNGRKEDIPEVLLRTVTQRPTNHQTSSKAGHTIPSSSSSVSTSSTEEYDDELFLDPVETQKEEEIPEPPAEPRPQPKIKHNVITTTPIASPPVPAVNKVVKSEPTVFSTTTSHAVAAAGSGLLHEAGAASVADSISTWTIAWNIHVYLSAIFFTILAVYSIFKIIFYKKVTHLFSQGYFIAIHILIICLCLLRIFFLCYDAYNIHRSFPIFLAELLLTFPAQLLVVIYAILILYLLLSTINVKQNHYKRVMRPWTIVGGAAVHIGLCITLHYVESREMTVQQQAFFNGRQFGTDANLAYLSAPPRVLSLICQIIYVFLCIALGVFYLYIYRTLKRHLAAKQQQYYASTAQQQQHYLTSGGAATLEMANVTYQNFYHQNLSYAIHITIATALLFILLAAVQVYGTVSLSTKPQYRILGQMSGTQIDIDWLQWGYQFSLRVIETAIIWLISWVTGLKSTNSGRGQIYQHHLQPMQAHRSVGGGATTSTIKLFQQQKQQYGTGGATIQTTSCMGLFPCASTTASSADADEHNGTLSHGGHQMAPDYDAEEYPAICTANKNVHSMSKGNCPETVNSHYDHYENPNFELHPGGGRQMEDDEFITGYQEASGQPMMPHPQMQMGNPGPVALSSSASTTSSISQQSASTRLLMQQQQNAFDFQNFERPNYLADNGAKMGTVPRNEFRASKNLKAFKQQQAAAAAAAGTLNGVLNSGGTMGAYYGRGSSGVGARNFNTAVAPSRRQGDERKIYNGNSDYMHRNTIGRLSQGGCPPSRGNSRRNLAKVNGDNMVDEMMDLDGNSIIIGGLDANDGSIRGGAQVQYKKQPHGMHYRGQESTAGLMSSPSSSDRSPISMSSGAGGRYEDGTVVPTGPNSTMLVAENGFVRFRAIDGQQVDGGPITHSTTFNCINNDDGEIGVTNPSLGVGQHKQLNKSGGSLTKKQKEKRYTNS